MNHVCCFLRGYLEEEVKKQNDVLCIEKHKLDEVVKEKEDLLRELCHIKRKMGTRKRALADWCEPSTNWKKPRETSNIIELAAQQSNVPGSETAVDNGSHIQSIAQSKF